MNSRCLMAAPMKRIEAQSTQTCITEPRCIKTSEALLLVITVNRYII